MPRSEAAAAAGSTTRTTRRLRRAGLHRRRDVLAGSRMDGRPRAAAAPREVVRPGGADAEAGRRFTVNSVVSEEFGRLMFLRVRNQNASWSTCPRRWRATRAEAAPQLSGRMIQIRRLDRGVDEGGGGPPARRRSAPRKCRHPAGTNWLFSNRAQWYPQGQVTDYAPRPHAHHRARGIQRRSPAACRRADSPARGRDAGAGAAGPGDVHLRRHAAAPVSRAWW